MATSGPRRSAVTIPASTVNRVVDQLVQRGRIAHGYLGIGMQPVAFPEGTRQSLGINADRGLLIVAVAPGGPAEKGGILLGDIIVTAEGASIQSMQSLQAFLDSENVGKSISLQVVRGGQLANLSVTVGEKQQN
jgi:S1-C subfamily serine protease